LRLILLGAPGTGKGTQGEMLAQLYKIPKISTGEILRDAIENKTKLGVQAEQFIKIGDLVPDDIMIDIVKIRLENEDCERGFILDGFPRTVPQARALDQYLTSRKISIDHIISLEVSKSELIKRLTSRRLCRNCGKDYNVLVEPLPQDMKCTICQGEIIQRSDDNEATVINRLKVYEEKTSSLKEYYRQKNILNIVKGEGTIEEIHQTIQEFLTLNDHCKKST